MKKFLFRMAILAIVFIMALLMIAPISTGTTAARGYVTGKYLLELNGQLCGFLWSSEGGLAYSEVVNESLGADNIQRKHIAGVKYSDITITFGTGMSKALYEWIKDSFSNATTDSDIRKSGAIIACSYDYKETSKLNFYNAVITEVTFPALDTASKDAAKITVTLSPEYTRKVKGTGKTYDSKSFMIQKKWLPANFKFSIEGLEKTTARVNKISEISFTRKVAENAIGEARDYQKDPASRDFADITFTFPEANSDDITKWFDSFVINGNNGEGAEKSGTISYLTPNLKETLFTMELHNLGIYKLENEPAVAGQTQISRLVATLYCEYIDFDYVAAWALNPGKTTVVAMTGKTGK